VTVTVRDRLGASVLGVRQFRWLWAGQLISSIGDGIFPVAVAVKILDSGGTARDLGFVLAGRAVALVVFVLFGGILADRMRRTTVMIGADGLRAIAVLGLALVPGEVPVAVLAALVFAVGAGEAFFRPAYGALLPTVLPPERLAPANAVTFASLKIAMIAGPAIAGVLAAAGGATLSFFVDAGTFVVSMLTLVRIAEPAVTRMRERASALREALEGVRAVRERPWVAAILGMATIHLMIGVGPVMVLLPVIARDRLGGEAAYGWLLAAFALGGLLGAIAGGRWRPRHRGVWACLGLLPWAAFSFVLAYADSFWPVAIAYAAAGFGLQPFMIWWESSLQQEIPREMLARVISLDWLASFGLLPVGLALTGPVVEATSRASVLVVGGIVMAVSSVVVLLVPGVADLRTRSRMSVLVREPAEVPPAA
jgi:DHA3 family tetracycline resistance protein-like MFS transporter